MKANELMIGDIVQINCFDKSTITIKVTTITNRDNITGITEDGYSHWCGIENVQPIPLSTEILENNGFKKTQIYDEKQDDIFQCFDGEIIIEVGIYDPNFILIRYRYETPDGINSGELSSIVKVDGENFYLHELQHALRLCGIEKEIIL